MIKNISLKDRQVATPYGVVTFDTEGVCKDLTTAQEKDLASKSSAFTYIEDAKPAKDTKPKEAKPEVEVEVEVAPPKAEKEKAPKKASTKSATPKK